MNTCKQAEIDGYVHEVCYNKTETKNQWSGPKHKLDL